MIAAAILATGVIWALSVLLRREGPDHADRNDAIGLSALLLMTVIWSALITGMVLTTMHDVAHRSFVNKGAHGDE